MENSGINVWDNPILPPTRRTTDAMLKALAETIPQWMAARDRERTLTFAELDQRTTNMAKNLIRRGVKPGDAVFIDLPVGVSLLESFLAINRMGAVPLFLHGLFHPEDVRGLTGSVSPVLCVGRTFHDTTLPIVEPGDLADGMQTGTGDYPKPSEDRIAWYRTTSGTTGRPKVIAVEHRQLCRRLPCPGPHYQPQTVYGAPLPNAFIGYQIVTALGAGGTVVFRPSATALQINRFIAEERLNYLWGVPALLHQIIRSRPDALPDVPDLKAITSSGARLDPEVLKTVEAIWRVPVYQFYGQSELGFLTECFDDTPKESVGRTVPGVELRIVGWEGGPLSPFESGRIQVRMNVPFGGYVTGETSPVEKDGWFTTGDLGYVDSDGNLYLSGRENDQIQVGGLKVNAGEIVEYIKGMTGVKDAYVFSVPHTIRGEVPAVAVGAEPWLKVEDVRKFCKKLPRHKQPGPIYLFPQLPQTPLGKIDKRGLMSLIEAANMEK